MVGRVGRVRFGSLCFGWDGGLGVVSGGCSVRCECVDMGLGLRLDTYVRD
jgi:hypothetical protein